MNILLLSKKKQVFLAIIIVITICVDIPGITYKASAVEEKLTNEQVKEEIEKIYNQRSACLVSGDTRPLKELFDTTLKYGKWALEHEVRRVKYLTSWADERDITFTKIQSWVRVKRV